MKSVLSERMPKERGALFHGDLVKQILAGTKRITRRPVKSQPAIPSYQVPITLAERAVPDDYVLVVPGFEP